MRHCAYGSFALMQPWLWKVIPDSIKPASGQPLQVTISGALILQGRVQHKNLSLSGFGSFLVSVRLLACINAVFIFQKRTAVALEDLQLVL